MTNSRDAILNKLRSTRPPFEDAPPKPATYHPVTVIEETTPGALLERFKHELFTLKGECFPVEGDEAARACVLDLLRSHNTKRILAWDFAHIPLSELENAIREMGVAIIQPNAHDEGRMDVLREAETAQVGLTGVDAAIAATGTMVFTTGVGKGRIPTILAPVHIAVVRLEQLVPRLENWVASLRAANLQPIRDRANVCFISGPSRTGDIEMELILGVHGPGKVQVVVVQ